MIHTIAQLEDIARKVRINIIRMLAEAHSGHTGGSLSCVEIVTTLYFEIMRHNSNDPSWPDRDRFVLSKGHAAPCLYSVLAMAGYFQEEELRTLRKIGTRLQGHPSMLTLPGVDMSSGSLGQGLSIANGMALAAKLDKRDYRVYALLGDGESEEGQVWEAAMTAAHYCNDNLCAIIDHNGLQIDGKVCDIMNPLPFQNKWRSFGWRVITAEGHSFRSLLRAFARALETKGCPTMIIAKTVKGKGVSFMENRVEYHGVAPTREERSRALEELEFSGESME
jgi:transketolase